jgi:hypothetical protein
MVHVLWRRPATSPTDAVNAEGAQFLNKYIVLAAIDSDRRSTGATRNTSIWHALYY